MGGGNALEEAVGDTPTSQLTRKKVSLRVFLKSMNACCERGRRGPADEAADARKRVDIHIHRLLLHYHLAYHLLQRVRYCREQH
jgi:hypothetical protein